MFIAGLEEGVNYSQLIVGEDVTLNGELQIVFDLELFSEFGYTPEAGQTFDLITAVDGITIDPSGIELLSFVTVEGSENISGLTLTPFDSGLAADPDNLLLIAENLFSFELVENNTILRATLLSDFNVIPEPSSLALMISAFLGLASITRKRSNAPRISS